MLVIGAAPERTGADPAAVEAVRKLVDAGARARVAASVVAELTGARGQRRSTAPSPPAPKEGQTPFRWGLLAQVL